MRFQEDCGSLSLISITTALEASTMKMVLVKENQLVPHIYDVHVVVQKMVSYV